MKYSVIIFFYCFPIASFGQDSIIVQKQYYEDAYNEIIEMLEGKKPYSFKKAVFVTENAYLNNGLEFEKFNKKIDVLTKTCSDYADANLSNFIYDYEDKSILIKYAAIFKIMTDSIPILRIGKHIVKTTPYTYDFNDFWGKENWTQMFVTKLIVTNTGNCHSLPFLYKIIAEEMGVSANLALAPNHIYIKHYSKKIGMYNTELTSAAFPIDAWLMASGYIHLNAIRNGIYMDTLSNKQSLSLCLFDLAKGYQRKFGSNDDFIMRCCEVSLKFYPNFINALLLKSEIMKKNFDNLMIQHNAKNPKDIFHIQEAKIIFDEYEQLILQIHKLGYRKMPEKMYLNWLLDLKENQEKYANKKVIDNFNPTKTN